jgi:hypothetical protein
MLEMPSLVVTGFHGQPRVAEPKFLLDDIQAVSMMPVHRCGDHSWIRVTSKWITCEHGHIAQLEIGTVVRRILESPRMALLLPSCVVCLNEVVVPTMAWQPSKCEWIELATHGPGILDTLAAAASLWCGLRRKLDVLPEKKAEREDPKYCQDGLDEAENDYEVLPVTRLRLRLFIGSGR